MARYADRMNTYYDIMTALTYGEDVEVVKGRLMAYHPDMLYDEASAQVMWAKTMFVMFKLDLL